MPSLTWSAGSAAGLPGEFAFRRGDVPREQDQEERGRNVPPGVLTVITEHLHVLESRSGLSQRRITELLIDTGRRPDVGCARASDCLQRDHDGKPTLIYTDSKKHGPAGACRSRRPPRHCCSPSRWVSATGFPRTPIDTLALFPREKGNKDGTKPIPATSYPTPTARSSTSTTASSEYGKHWPT